MNIFQLLFGFSGRINRAKFWVAVLVYVVVFFGGMMIATAAGWILQLTGSYHSLFVLAGCAYLLALLVIHLLVPRLEPARIGEEARA